MKHGALHITLGPNKTFLIRRLVALAFIPNPQKKPFVIHRKADPENCRASNLVWATKAEIAARIQKGIPVEQLHRTTGKVIRRFKSMHEACAKSGTNHSSLRNFLRGKQKHANGFHWRYAG